MIGLLQRVAHARVDIQQQTVASIDQGLLVLVGIEKEDDAGKADRLLERILGYRVFPDDKGRMNRSLQEVNGGLLLVPQFTLAADTRKGMRPSFSKAASPGQGEELFEYLLVRARTGHHRVEAGRFGADMQISLCNDGPTFTLTA